MHSLGWAETSNFALVRAFADGKPEIDRWHWETKDKSWYDGHFYSVKAPGLALVAAPAYKALTAVGGTEASADLARNAREGGATRWEREGTSKGLYSDDPQRAERVRTTIEESTPMVWALGLIGGRAARRSCCCCSSAPWSSGSSRATGRRPRSRSAPARLILPFSTLFFSHVLSAMLAFAAFAVLWRERAGPERLLLVAAAGALAGFAIVTEYPLGAGGGRARPLRDAPLAQARRRLRRRSSPPG